MDLTTFLIFLGGVILGSLISKIINNRYSSIGILKVDNSNPEHIIFRLCLDESCNITKHKKVIMTIDSHADLTQK